MGTEIKCLSISVTFSLPNWTADERFEFTKNHYFDAGHAWAGSYDRTTLHNRLDDALFSETQYEELCLDPNAQWIKYDISLKGNVYENIRTQQEKIQRVLDRWRDWEPENLNEKEES